MILLICSMMLLDVAMRQMNAMMKMSSTSPSAYVLRQTATAAKRPLFIPMTLTAISLLARPEQPEHQEVARETDEGPHEHGSSNSFRPRGQLEHDRLAYVGPVSGRVEDLIRRPEVCSALSLSLGKQLPLVVGLPGPRSITRVTYESDGQVWREDSDQEVYEATWKEHN